MAMKKFFMVLVLFLLVFNVSAQEDVSEEEDVGITPDSALYGLDGAWKRMRLAFTFSKEAKARKELRFAKERLREIDLMVERGKVDAAEKAKERHRNLLRNVRNRVEVLGEDSEEDLDLNLELENEIEDQEDKIEEIKTRIDIKGELNEEQRQRLRNFMEDLRKDGSEVRLEIENKKDKLRVRLEEKGIDRETIEKRIEDKREEHRDKAIDNRIKHVRREIEKSRRMLEERGREEGLGDLKEAEAMLERAHGVFHDENNLEETKRLVNGALRLAVGVRSNEDKDVRDKLSDARQILKRINEEDKGKLRRAVDGKLDEEEKREMKEKFRDVVDDHKDDLRRKTDREKEELKERVKDHLDERKEEIKQDTRSRGY
jgi:hypothetical protein